MWQMDAMKPLIMEINLRLTERRGEPRRMVNRQPPKNEPVVVRPQVWGPASGMGVRVAVPGVSLIRVLDQFEYIVRNIGFPEQALFGAAIGEADDVEKLLAGQVNLLAKDVLLDRDHHFRAAPHPGAKRKRIHELTARRRIQGPPFVPADAVDGMAYDAALADEKRPSPRWIHGWKIDPRGELL